MLSEEEYEKKGDTLRSFLQRNRLGKYNEEETNKLKEEQQKELQEEARCFKFCTIHAVLHVQIIDTIHDTTKDLVFIYL